MEQNQRAIDTLARYIIYGTAAAAIGALCWFFRDVIVYILIAGVLSLIGQPLMKLLKKIRIRNRSLPDWLCAALSIVLILLVFFSIVILIFPVVASVFKDISMVDVSNTVKSISVPLQNFNDFMMDKFPNLGNDFKIEKVVLEQLQKFVNITMFSSFLSSVTSFLTSFGIGLFSVVFISFFFFKNEHLFSRIVVSLVPDRHEKNVVESIDDIHYLLTRYFLGLLTEVAGVATLNFIGLLLIARMGFNASIGIAFMTGLLNIIPYVGPLTGGVIGTVFAVVIKYICATHLGLDVSFWVFILIVAAIFCVTQLVDNFLFQPIIYSSSIKAHPLEIFIVLLMAGHIGGIIGMLVAIPSYTCLRVIAGRFFRNVKFIRALIPDRQQENAKQSEQNE
ncbi:MAG: AI-2E family transporter [Bacteroidales bacterium]|nr:AI-2E family transporter [Bacteroidales bacterium]